MVTEYIETHFIQTASSLIPIELIAVENGVDELKQAYETSRQTIAPSNGSLFGVDPVIWMIIAAVLLIGLLMLLAIWLFNRRRADTEHIDHTDDTLWGQEYEVRDMDYEVTSDNLAEVVFEEPDAPEIAAEMHTPAALAEDTVPAMAEDVAVPNMDLGYQEETAISGLFENDTAETKTDEAELIDITNETELLDTDETTSTLENPADEDIQDNVKRGFFGFGRKSKSAETNQNEEDTPEDIIEFPLSANENQETGNDIHFEADTLLQNDLSNDSLDTDTAIEDSFSKSSSPFAASETTVIDTDTETPNIDVENSAEDTRRRYAFAASASKRVAFSGISGGNDDTSVEKTAEEATPQSYEPYIAPIVKEDLERADQRQEERIGLLRLDVDRSIERIREDNATLMTSNNERLNARMDNVIHTLDQKMEEIAERQTLAQQKAFQPLTGMPAEVSGRVAVLDDRITQTNDQILAIARQVSGMEKMLETQGQRLRAITRILDDRLSSVTHVYGEVRDVSDKMDNVSGQMHSLERAVAESKYTEEVLEVDLNDIIQGVLVPGSYQFKLLMSNNQRADCVIRLPHPAGSIAIDTGFPMTAFAGLPTAYAVSENDPDARAAVDSFKRTVLRYLVDISEKLIIPGETTNSVMTFIPTEAAYTLLHNRFPDIIDDAYRANVWIVSPATLMGTLQTIGGVLQELDDQTSQTEKARREAREAMAEVEDLRAKAAQLAENFAQTQNELSLLVRENENLRGHDRERSYRQTVDKDTYYSSERGIAADPGHHTWPDYNRDEPRPRSTSIFDKDRDPSGKLR